MKPETQEIVITRHGKPAEILIGFESEEDWFEYRLENDPQFLRRIEQARNSLPQAGRGVLGRPGGQNSGLRFLIVGAAFPGYWLGALRSNQARPAPNDRRRTSSSIS